ncbi:MAG: hypothetical protein OXC40_05020, partial [Proteobacteria bacterium]|nr:hypothetical protein [Pseudomonadota bacterium]
GEAARGDLFFAGYSDEDKKKVEISLGKEINFVTDIGFFGTKPWERSQSNPELAGKTISNIEFIEISRRIPDVFTTKYHKTYQTGFFGNKKQKFDRYRYHERNRFKLRGLSITVTSGSRDIVIYNREDIDAPFHSSYDPNTEGGMYWQDPMLRHRPEYSKLYFDEDHVCDNLSARSE